MAEKYTVENSSGSEEDVVRLKASGTAVGLDISDILIRKNSASFTVLIEPAKANRPLVKKRSDQSRASSNGLESATPGRFYKHMNTDLQKQSMPPYDIVRVQDDQARARRLHSRWPTTIEEAKRRERLRAIGNRSSTDTCLSTEGDSPVKVKEKPEAVRQTGKESLGVQRAPGKLIMVQPASACMTFGDQDEEDELADNQAYTENATETEESPRVGNVPEGEEEDIAPAAEPTPPPRKKRGKFRRAVRMIGKFFSHWCYPALDTRD